MNRTEAAILLGHCAAFDNRQPSEFAAQAWAAALHDVPLDQDAKDAIVRYYTTTPKNPETRLWIMPHHVRDLRAKIRAERLENFAYETPNPDESPREYLARYRGQLEAVASGAVPAPSTAPMLEGGPHRSMAELLSGSVKHADDPEGPEPQPTVERRASGPQGVICPDCNAAIGRPCKSRLRRKPRQPHPARRRAAAGEPIRLTSDEEINARRHLATHHLDPIIEEQP
ncbi:zinc finger domain-containing protein [Streptomyces misionensis]|uniref:zinc finger domain-containing protein n=1 Tax=Streptomyces misionensis TaxID=67331 RepID=UPI00368262F8